MIEVLPLDESRLPAFAALMEACACACHCRYWHFSGNKNEWLARCAFAAEENLAEQAAAVRAREEGARGLLAMEHGVALGWMKLAPRATVPKLRRLSVYRALDLGADEGVYAIGCFLVRPDARKRGVARALVAGAEAAVRAWGGRAIEAYPRKSDDTLHDEEAWMGPSKLFLEQGYAAVHDDGPYPVLRKSV